jgi:hypothetical protein
MAVHEQKHHGTADKANGLHTIRDRAVPEQIAVLADHGESESSLGLLGA